MKHYARNWGLNDSHNPLQFQCDDIYESSREDIDTKKGILKIEKISTVNKCHGNQLTTEFYLDGKLRKAFTDGRIKSE